MEVKIKIRSSGLWRRIVSYVGTNIQEETATTSETTRCHTLENHNVKKHFVFLIELIKALVLRPCQKLYWNKQTAYLLLTAYRHSTFLTPWHRTVIALWMKLLWSRETVVGIHRFWAETDYFPVAAILGRGQQGQKLSAVKQLRNMEVRILLMFTINLSFWISFISSSVGHFAKVTNYSAL
jgi:hypothetical protein